MIDKHIKKTKFHFTVGMIFLIATLISGIAMFKDVPYFSYDFFIKNLDYLKYKQKIGTFTIYDSSFQEHANSIPVLVYHGLIENPREKDDSQQGEGINISPDKFFDQMLSLKRDGWNTISIYDFYDFLQGRKTLPQKSFLLTFDDGRKDSYYPADSVLKALGFRATIFVITERSLNSNKRSSFYLSMAELKDMTKSGRWDIESHGKGDHSFIPIDADGNTGTFVGNKLWRAGDSRIETDEEFFLRISSDLKAAKDEIESKIGTKVTAYAFPFGDYGSESKNYPEAQSIVEKISRDIYNLSFYQVSASDSEIFNLPGNSGFAKRIKGGSSLSGDEIVTLLEKSKPKAIPFEDGFDFVTGWKKNWGNMSVENGSMNVESSGSSTTAFVTLSGSSHWKNYLFESEIFKKSGETFSIVAYSQNDESYLCTISDRYIKLQKSFGKEIKTLSEYKLRDEKIVPTTVGAGKNYRSEFSCRVGENIYVADGAILNDDVSGQIGFKVWDAVPGNARISVEKVFVREEPIESLNLPVINAETIQAEIMKKLEQQQSENQEKTREKKQLEPLPVPFEWTGKSNVQWERNWGEVSLSDIGLSVSAPLQLTGAMAILPGTERWQNFTDIIFSAEWIAGSNLVFVYRYQDEDNYGTVNFHNDYIRIEERLNGKNSILEEKRRNFSESNNNGFYKRSLFVKVSLENNDVTVWSNGEKIISTSRQRDLPFSGKIGVKSWDKDPGKSSAVIHFVSVEARK